MITQTELRKLLDYFPETGIFRWRFRKNARPQWNGRYAGTKAGCQIAGGYIKIVIDNQAYYAHRLAWLYLQGKWPEAGIDHRDGNPSNNKFDNLRPATQVENMHNTPAQKNNTSGFKGVTWHRQRRKWAAQAYIEGKHIHIGLFESKEDAARAYNQAIENLHGEFARPNKLGAKDGVSL
ncbi:MAG: HNH endonuclease [Proteobacteria bacterium]|nr:HNH endonuclease [Pseudomonadota bacterium]